MFYFIDSIAEERRKDLLQEAERERLIRIVRLQQPGNWKLHRKVVGWIGAQMVSWGSKLQSYGTISPPCRLQVTSE